MNIKYLVKDGSGDLYVPIYPFHQETYELAGGGPGSGSLVNKKLRIAVMINIADESVTYTLLNYNYFAFISEIEILGERHTFPITGQGPFTWQFDKPGKYTFYITLRPGLPDNIGSPTLFDIRNIITSISLPYGIETLPQSFFAGMGMPNVDIVLPSSVKRLNLGQLSGCSLHKLVIPKNCIVNSYGINGCAPEILEFHGTFVDLNIPFCTYGSAYLNLNTSRLKKIVIDCKNTKIGSCNAMSQCEEVEVSGNVDTLYSGCFAGNSNIKKVTLSGNKLKEIQNNVFASCTSLVDISIADSVEDIQPGAFGGCTSLKYIKLPNSLKVLKSGVFNGNGLLLETVVLPEGLEEILSGAFAGISTLKNVNIPSTITIIPYLCFAGTGLLNIDIPNNIITIGSAAFAASQLVEINIPNSVTTIEGGAFSNCKLQKIYVPNSVVNIGDTIFNGNHNTLEEVYIDSDAITAKSTGSYQPVYRSLFPRIFGSSSYINIKKVELGPHVTTIGRHAFYKQYPSQISSQKVEIIFGESVKEILLGAFLQADPANELDLSHVETIGQGAFYSSFDRDIQKTIRLSSIKSIPNDSTFYNLSVENLIIDSPCTTLNIAKNAFYSTYVYNTLRIDSNVTFGESSFSWLDRILSDTYGLVKNIIFGDLVHNSLQNISTSIFSACTACKYVHFGRNILAVPRYMFQGNTNLTTVEHYLIRVCEHAFYGCTALQSFDTSTIKIYDRESFKNSSLGGIIQIPSDGSVGYLAFYNTNITRFICEGTIISDACPLTNCKYLEYILVNSGLDCCVNYSFSQLVSLKTVVTNDAILGYLTNFPALETIVMSNPEVTFNLGNGDVFNNSPNLKDIYIYNKTAPELGGMTFNGCAENVKVHVPANATGYEAWVDGSTAWYYPYKLHWEIVKDLDPVYDKLVVYHDIQNTSTPTTILTNYDGSVKSINIDGKETISEVPQGNVTYLFNKVGQHTIKVEFNNPTAVGNNAPLFYQLTTVKSVVIPDTFTTIGAKAFRECSSLTSITIPNSVTSIGNEAFYGTEALTTLNYDAQCELNTSFRSRWSNLETVVIGDSTPAIGDGSFSGCSSLTSVTIGSSVTSIGNGALSICSSLTSVTIGSGVTSIGQGAFASCSNLSTITSHIMNAPSVADGTFNGVKTGGTLSVPTGSTGYDTWMNNRGNLGAYNWTKVEQ